LASFDSPQNKDVFFIVAFERDRARRAARRHPNEPRRVVDRATILRGLQNGSFSHDGLFTLFNFGSNKDTSTACWGPILNARRKHEWTTTEASTTRRSKAKATKIRPTG